jgi:hypothetical protein
VSILLAGDLFRQLGLDYRHRAGRRQGVARRHHADLIHDIEPAGVILNRIVAEAEAALTQRFDSE